MTGTYVTRKSTAAGRQQTLTRRAARWVKYGA